MRFSLLNQFQSGLIGTFIAEKLTGESKKSLLIATPWSQMVGQVTERLILYGPLTQSDWSDLYQNLQANGINKSEGVFIATIPLILMFHDHLKALSEQLQLLQEVWQFPVQMSEDVLIWGYTIALILREKAQPQLLPQLLATQSTVTTPLLEGLKKVQMFLDNQIPLAQGVKQLDRQTPLSSTAIALALYIFSSTPSDFRLCLLRANQIPEQSKLITFLVGLLAGLSNSMSGIPIAWRIASQKDPLGQQLYQLASQLFALWSGVYPSNSLPLSADVAVASVGVIQPRSSLKIISQQEF